MVQRLQVLALAIVGVAGRAAGPAATVTVAIDPGSPPGFAIPADFAGLSVESSHLLPDSRDGGRRFFRGDNRELIGLFRSIGIRDLRVGGGTAEDKRGIIPVPGPADIDPLFDFARAADIRIIYTLRLLKGSEQQDAELARYIWEHHRDRLKYFQIGNEPDWRAYHSRPGQVTDPRIFEADPNMPGSAYPSYLADWRRFAAAIRAAAPGAMFGGPDTGSNYPEPGTKDTDSEGKSWTQRFADDERGSGLVVEILPHDYIGESAAGVSVPAAIDAMLSRRWVESNYRIFHDHALAPVIADGFRYRMTECNDYTGGVNGASNAFVSALWALDYMHWQAEHGASGVNFHNRRWIFTDTVYEDRSGTLHYNPKAFAIRAFDEGGAGKAVEPVRIANPEGLNLTAYAVRGDDGHFVTILNKEHGAGARPVEVVIAGARRAHALRLTAPGNDPGAREGATLGGSAFASDGSWQGHWDDLRDGRLTVPPTSAVVVRFER